MCQPKGNLLPGVLRVYSRSLSLGKTQTSRGGMRMPMWEVPADIAAGMLSAIIVGILITLHSNKSKAYEACYMMRKWMIAGFLGQAIFRGDFPCFLLAIGFGTISTLQLHWYRRTIVREKRN